MGSNRAEKLAGTLKKTISTIIQNEIRDPRIGFVTITQVQSTADLKYVKVYYSVLGSESQKKSAMIGLRHATVFIRQMIAKEVRLRVVPEIVFKVDDTHEYEIRIGELLERIRREDEQRSKTGNSGAAQV